MFPVELDNVTVAYHKKPVLQDISLQVPEGKLIGIIGPNGAGKSTLIKTILGLVPRASGDILFTAKTIRISGPESDMFRSAARLTGISPQARSMSS